ncbi:hypothetical protein [Geodermatophilus sp. DSM 45219]|uniref:hypothetical protein n=1 Tax=Geodermatophilus sp. DSM 45219 TaxID=1881103 RepID=UPI00115FCB0B|nr:hypothetical protein [Geodermatophilus sp. DSM 45219]
MKARGPKPTNDSQSLRTGLAVLSVAYVGIVTVVVGVAYWINPEHVEPAIEPAVGGLIGLLILSTPPARRWLTGCRRR